MNTWKLPRIVVSPGSFGLAFVVSLGALALPSRAFALQFPTTHFVSEVAIGDINSDGIEDIVTCGDADDTSSVDVLLGNGDGTFQNPTQSFVGSGPGAIALGDFNGDGNLDVATANFGIDDASSRTISVLLGHGDGTFQRRHNYVVGGSPNSIVATDLNNDGVLDFVVGRFSRFVVLLGNGDGSFDVTSEIKVPSNNDSVAVGDLNGDGEADVLVGNRTQTKVSIFLGNGDGTFQPRMQKASGFPLVHSTLVDVNGDGVLDLLGLFSTFPASLAVYLGNGDGTFNQPWNVALSALQIDDFAAGDWNGDGNIDLAVTALTQTGEVFYIFLGNGDGTFQVSLTSFSIGKKVASGLFNADSALDLVGGGGVSLSVRTLYGLGDGTFVNQPPLP